MSKTQYVYEPKAAGERPEVIIRWCRRNLGVRNHGWDSWLINKKIVIEIWDDKLKTMYEMWQL